MPFRVAAGWIERPATTQVVAPRNRRPSVELLRLTTSQLEPRPRMASGCCATTDFGMEGIFDGEDARAAAARVAERLSADPRVRLVFLYGSAADARRSHVRDVDIAIATSPRLDFEALMRLRADAVAVAGMPVDLIDVANAGVVLAWEVAETGRCLFARDPDDEATFVTRARAGYWDFKPFLEEQWRLAGERLDERQHGPET